MAISTYFEGELLITVEELQDRLRYVLSDSDRNVAKSVIWDASNLARHHGKATWTREAVPPIVKTIVRNACVRYMDLIDSVLLSRAGDEAEQYTDLREKTGTVFFTDDELGTIREVAGRSGNFHNPTVAVFNSSRHATALTPPATIPWDGAGNKPFPVGEGAHGGW